MLDVRELAAGYGRARILDNLSLSLGTNEVVLLLGRNGAGKSTTLKAIMGLVPPAEGFVVFEGRSIQRLSPRSIAGLGIGYVPEERRIFTGLTVRENLEVARQPPRRGVPLWTLDSVLELFPHLASLGNRPGGSLSGGEQQMLTIARTLMGNPRLVLLDEPSEGLAPRVVDEMARNLQAVKKRGVSILLAEQNLRFASRVGDRAYVLEKGAIRFGGTLQELLEDRTALGHLAM